MPTVQSCSWDAGDVERGHERRWVVESFELEEDGDDPDGHLRPARDGEGGK